MCCQFGYYPIICLCICAFTCSCFLYGSLLSSYFSTFGLCLYLLEESFFPHHNQVLLMRALYLALCYTVQGGLNGSTSAISPDGAKGNFTLC